MSKSTQLAQRLGRVHKVVKPARLVRICLVVRIQTDPIPPALLSPLQSSIQTSLKNTAKEFRMLSSAAYVHRVALMHLEVSNPLVRVAGPSHDLPMMLSRRQPAFWLVARGTLIDLIAKPSDARI